jgi:hypothetical protein
MAKMPSMINKDQRRIWSVATVMMSMSMTMGCKSGSSSRGNDGAGEDSGDVADGVSPAETENDQGGGDQLDTAVVSEVSTADAPVQMVEMFGCFATSGDSYDILAEGPVAPVVVSAPWRPACGGQWISTNVNGYTVAATPVTAIMTRRFTLGGVISDRATLTVTFEADDAVELVLNGQPIATCTPPETNAGECQQSCHTATFPRDVLAPAGMPNVLEIRLINLFNADAGGGNVGWTGVSYSICADGE